MAVPRDGDAAEAIRLVIDALDEWAAEEAARAYSTAYRDGLSGLRWRLAEARQVALGAGEEGNGR